MTGLEFFLDFVVIIAVCAIQYNPNRRQHRLAKPQTDAIALTIYHALSESSNNLSKGNAWSDRASV